MVINPNISIIIPVHNRPELLNKCLHSIYMQKFKNNFETIVVDDNSTINLKSVIKKYPIRHYYLKERNGPGFARNFGAKKAKGKILLFIDSDVLSSKGFLDRVEKAFNKNKEIAALQGNYTLIPFYTNFFSFFKNITLYYYFKKTSATDSNSIASFCTAIRKDIFIKSGGFNQKIKNASVEDEEFGIELTRNGYRILYDNKLQVRHMKRFNFYTLMKQDFRTGFDKIKSLLRKRNLFDKKELKGSHSSFSLLVSIPIASIIILNIIFLFFINQNLLLLTLLLMLEVFFLINLDYFLYIMKNRNIVFSVFAFIFSIMNNFVIQLGIIFGFIDYFLGKKY